MFRIPKMLVVAALTLSGCGVFGTPCEAQFDKLCQICPKNDQNQILCNCLEDGTLTAADADDAFDDDIEAQQFCDEFRFSLRYQGDDGKAQCRASKAYLDEWDVQACADFGFEN